MENIENTGTENTATETPATKEKKAPAYLAFVAACRNHAEIFGEALAVKEQKGYFQFKNPTTNHRLVIAKQGKAVTRIDTTLEVLGQEGTLPLEMENGRIACHISPDLETVQRYLEVLAKGESKLRAPKRQPKAPKAEAATEAQASA